MRADHVGRRSILRLAGFGADLLPLLLPHPPSLRPFTRHLSATLTHILNAPPAPELPSSPGSIISSTLTTDSTALEPTPPSSAAILEYKLLQLLLNVLSGAAPPSATLPELTITLKEPVLASSLGGSPTLPQRGKKDPLVSMLALKAHLGEFAKERGWDESGGTTAIYGLVSKGVVRIDRRGREGGLVGLRV